MSNTLSRRSFLKGSAGAVLAISIPSMFYTNGAANPVLVNNFEGFWIPGSWMYDAERRLYVPTERSGSAIPNRIRTQNGDYEVISNVPFNEMNKPENFAQAGDKPSIWWNDQDNKNNGRRSIV